MAKAPWYQNYGEKRKDVLEAKKRFHNKCRQLGVKPYKVLLEVQQDIIARIVHESNWQEGLYLDMGRTKELTDVVFDDLTNVEGPHIDFGSIIDAHRKRVLKFKRNRISVEELASYNLSFGHVALDWIARELSQRQSVGDIQTMNLLRDFYEEHKDKMSKNVQIEIENVYADIEQLKTDNSVAHAPLTQNIATQGELIRELEKTSYMNLINPMRIEYIHFLHRIIMMGILPSKKIGVFRKGPVHVGDPDVFFPPASTVPKLMEQYCEKFPIILPTLVDYDVIKTAAEISYKFARIHPYSDGNGRISRLLMNLVLWAHFPPVYLKADKKGRHRYGQALKRANRGNIEPLSCLIALSLKELYKKFQNALEAK